MFRPLSSVLDRNRRTMRFAGFSSLNPRLDGLAVVVVCAAVFVLLILLPGLR